ncbi:GTP 3',8-cyclase MoaA [Neomoorella thermoacetica]|uniref:GTP 3',8-cyclase n=1 Tax=Moorella thermoacetica Y72 TaxID=1325331 RepID=A0A0S6UCY8_NEOTH|nr:GTP 3',8-cyclase MoaA [Moorella thermoacetica]OIQ54858.1 cyclic pyranopterin monophosphate synthase [Moorella thermoacetica]GAF25369.1 molybdenum cofactor biosynthesis enzyme [Moorella thermoacetica Y72]
MQDTFQRQINYLRIAITDRCNLRCRYCMPATGVPLKGHEDILRLEEIATLARVAAGTGISRIRLTGGEPLVRKNVVTLVRELAAIPGLEEISLTTNGIFLGALAFSLKEAGLKRVNISLDTLKKDRYRYITRRGNITSVWQGIRAALAAGLTPVKLNVVITRGFNDDEILDFARLAREEPLHIRFIELMPIGTAAASSTAYVPAEEIKGRISRVYPLEPFPDLANNGPAANFRLVGGRGSVGFITPMSNHFCSRCNRLRLTADGKLRPCLYWDGEIDIKGPLRAGAPETELAAIFARAVSLKPAEHHMENGWRQPRAMSQIGG